MEKKNCISFLVLFGLLNLFSQPIQATAPVVNLKQSVEPVPAFRATRLIGREVQSVEREPLGAVEDLVIDSRSNTLFLVISYGGFLGLGDKLTAVPWSALAITEQDGPLFVNIDRERFLVAPTFDREGWKQIRNPEFLSQVLSYYPKKSLGGRSDRMGNLLPPTFAQLDTDSNGIITVEEAKSSFVLSERFRLADKNRDAGVSPEELETFRADLLKAWKGGEGKPVPMK